jgi:hypothetical protein
MSDFGLLPKSWDCIRDYCFYFWFLYLVVRLLCKLKFPLVFANIKQHQKCVFITSLNPSHWGSKMGKEGQSREKQAAQEKRKNVPGRN